MTDRDFTFRELRADEIPVMFDIILARIRWMDKQGIKSWNTTNYVERFPLSYYEEKRRKHEAFAIVEQDTGRILCAGVLKQEDDRWDDDSPALYVHNLVADRSVKGAGSAFLRCAEDYARSLGKDYLRLDSIEGNPAITVYYERQGFRAVGTCVDGAYHGILREKRLYGGMTREYRDLLEQAKEYAVAYMDGIDDKRAFPSVEQLASLSQFDGLLPETGEEAADVLALLHRVGSPATTAQAGGRYFGFVNGGLLPIAHAAAWLSDTWNQNGALYLMSPAASHLEQVCEGWVRELFGLPDDTALGLVTGSSNALICALAAARNELLRRQGYDIAAKGLRSAPQLRAVLGAGAHSAVRSALSVLGFGSDELEVVPVDSLGRIIPEQVPALDERTLLILQAGNVNGGAYDDFDTLCDRARAAGAWVHIDGAFGLWAACSKKYRHLTKGFEKADSWVTDAHKTLNAGYDCGLVLCRCREALANALAASGAYIAYGENRDGMRYSTEMSRRTRGVMLYATLRSLGRAGVEELIDRLCDNAAYFAGELERAGFALVNPPQFNQFMVKCETADETARVLRAVQNGGVCWCGESVWEGERVIRVSVCSHATTREDIDQSVRAFAEARRETEVTV